MKLALLGATGATGRWVLDKALADGHEVAALARDPAKLDPARAGLRVVKGSAASASDVEQIVRGADAVIGTLGPRQKADPICVQAAEATVSAMKSVGVKRVVWLSASGVGDSRPTINRSSFVFGRIIIPLFLKVPYANHEKAEETFRASGLDWTVLRPLQLVDKPTGNPVAVHDGDGPLKGLAIARQDLAAFILRTAGGAEYVGRMPLVYA
jgi:uncharacterized protein YbjT (DUF2867 family)